LFVFDGKFDVFEAIYLLGPDGKWLDTDSAGAVV
jgi:hypothetical protein